MRRKNKELSQRVVQKNVKEKYLHDGYEYKLCDKVIKDDKDKQRIKTLEAFENILIDRLKATHVKQRNQYENLSNLAKESHGVYAQGFAQRNEKYKQTFPNSLSSKQFNTIGS